MNNSLDLRKTIEIALGINNYISENYDDLLTKKSVRRGEFILSSRKLVEKKLASSESIGNKFIRLYETNIIKACILLVIARYDNISFVINNNNPRKLWVHLSDKESLITRTNKVYGLLKRIKKK